MSYLTMNKEQLQEEYTALTKHFADCKAQNLNLNMARGKPSAKQLDIVHDILDCLNAEDTCKIDGIDARNYGELAGLPAARVYWADVLGCKPEQTISKQRLFLLSRRDQYENVHFCR